MNAIKKLASDTVLYGISSIVGRLLNWLLVIIHTRIFVQPEILAENAFLYTIVLPLNIIYTFGMETAFFRFASKKEHRNEYFSIILTFILLLGSSLSMVFVVFSDLLAAEIGYPDKGRLIVWLAVIIVVDAICAIAFVKLRAENRAKKFVAIKLTNITINIGLNIFFLVVCGGILAGDFLPEWKSYAAYFYSPEIGADYIIWANYVASLITLLLLWKEFVGYRFVIAWEKLKTILSYAYPLLLLGLAGSINLTADRLMFRSLLPEGFYTGLSTDDAFSIYAQCYKLSIFMTLVVQAYRYAADPFFFAKMGDKNSPKIIALSTKWFTIACIALWIFVVANLDWIQLLIGETYRIGIVVVPILLLANLFIGVYGNLSIWYKLSDKTFVGTWITLAGMSFTILLNLVLIPLYGYVGSAITFVISAFFMTAACYILGQKSFPIPYDLKKVLLYLFIGGLLVTVVSMISQSNMTLDIIIKNLVFATFFVLLYFLERRNINELKA